MTQPWKEGASGWVGQMGMSPVRHRGIIPSAGSVRLVSGIITRERCGHGPEERKASGRKPAKHLWGCANEERGKAFVFSLGKARLNGDRITIFKHS